MLQKGTSSAELIVRIYLAKSAPHNQMEAAAAMSASCGLSAKVSPPALTARDGRRDGLRRALCAPFNSQRAARDNPAHGIRRATPWARTLQRAAEHDANARRLTTCSGNPRDLEP